MCVYVITSEITDALVGAPALQKSDVQEKLSQQPKKYEQRLVSKSPR